MRRARVVIVLVSAVLVVAAFAGCSTAGPPDSTPMLRGVIVSVAPGADGGVVRVVWHESLGERTELDSCDVSVGQDTDVFGEDGASLAFADLSERDIVEVWISGPIAESYPPQATADAIAVGGEYDALRPLPIPPGLVAPE